MSEYSNYVMGEVELETEKAYLAPIEKFTEEAIWIPKAVVEPKTRRIQKWFIEKKDTEIKDHTRPRNQSSMEEFIENQDWYEKE